MSLTNKTIANSYKDLLQVDNSNNGIGTSVGVVKDGEGTSSAVAISDDHLVVRPNNDNTTTTLNIRTAGGDSVLVVDTTNEIVKASGNIVNTQYANFGSYSTATAGFAINTHHPLLFATAGLPTDVSNPPAFGTGTDPATTFTTAEGNGTRASDLVTLLWYVNDAISIDAIKSIEGAVTATGDTTRMHLFSYDFTSGATACLTNGALVAHNSDVTNAGSEQPYLSTWTVDSATVTAGKVILAFFRSDSINSDYSLQVTVKYHLT